MKNKKYFLVGMPATGKSTIGRLVARQLGLKFIDLDDVIVEHEGKEINHIFSEEGEDYFRKVERYHLIELINHLNGFILATGGGAPCFFDNMDLMNQNGVTIFLNVPVEELYNKLIIKGTQKRPLLKDLSQDDLLAEITTKFNDRKKYYDQSKISLAQNLKNITDRVNQVIYAIKSLEE